MARQPAMPTVAADRALRDPDQLASTLRGVCEDLRSRSGKMPDLLVCILPDIGPFYGQQPQAGSDVAEKTVVPVSSLFQISRSLHELSWLDIHSFLLQI